MLVIMMRLLLVAGFVFGDNQPTGLSLISQYLTTTQDVNCDLILVLFPLTVVPLDIPLAMKDSLRTHRDYEPDYSYLPEGVVEFDTIQIEYPD